MDTEVHRRADVEARLVRDRRDGRDKRAYQPPDVLVT